MSSYDSYDRDDLSSLNDEQKIEHYKEILLIEDQNIRINELLGEEECSMFEDLRILKEYLEVNFSFPFKAYWRDIDEEGHEILVDVLGLKEEFDRRGLLFRVEYLNQNTTKISRYVLVEQIHLISPTLEKQLQSLSNQDNSKKQETPISNIIHQPTPKFFQKKEDDDEDEEEFQPTSRRSIQQNRLREILNTRKRNRNDLENNNNNNNVEEKKDKEDDDDELNEIYESNKKKSRSKEENDSKTQINKLIDCIMDMKNEIGKMREEMQRNNEDLKNDFENFQRQIQIQFQTNNDQNSRNSSYHPSNLTTFQIHERILSDYKFWLKTLEELQIREFDHMNSRSDNEDSIDMSERPSFDNSADYFDDLDGSEFYEDGENENTDPNKWVISYNEDI